MPLVELFVLIELSSKEKEKLIEKEQKNQQFTINKVIVVGLLVLMVVLGVLIFLVPFPYEATQAYCETEPLTLSTILSYKELSALCENKWDLSQGCYYVANVVIQSTSDYTGDLK